MHHVLPSSWRTSANSCPSTSLRTSSAGIKERRKRATLRSTSTACKRTEERPCVLTPLECNSRENWIQCFRNSNRENTDNDSRTTATTEIANFHSDQSLERSLRRR